MYYIKTLKQKLSTAKTYEHNLLDEMYVIDRHRFYIATKFVNEEPSKLPMLYRLPKLHKTPTRHVLLLILAHVLLLSCL